MNTDDITEPAPGAKALREQLTQLINIKIENILERYIIYLKDRFNYEDNKEFDYEYVDNNLPHYENIEGYNYALENAYDHYHPQKYLTYHLYKKECYIYFQELVNDNFENLYYNECYDYIIDILEDYRGLTNNKYFENWDEILNEIDDEGEQNYINIEINNRYKFWNNIDFYFEIILDEYSDLTELNKVDFVKSIIDSLNNQVFLK